MSKSSSENTGKILLSPRSIEYHSQDVNETHLGEGGFGVVRKGFFEGKPVAVKKFIIDKENDDDVMTKASLFLGEAKNMREMNHPRIVKFLGFIMEEMAIVMEFMERGNLQEYIEKEADIKWSQRFIFMMDIADGMNYLHAKVDADGKSKKSVFHQDLKSANILLTMEDGILRGKISDFGFSSK
jgi:serine/threonine protein kinase